MPFPLGRTLIALLALVTATGCPTMFTSVHHPKSPLMPARMSADSCVLDVFFVNVPFNDPQANESIWADIDEQRLNSDLRERLRRNGFRAGVIGGQMPGSIAQLLELNDKPAPTGEIEGTNSVELANKPRVTRRHMQLRAGQRSLIVSSGVYEQLPVLYCESGQVGGEIFEQAHGVLAVKAFPQPGGNVRIELLPEVHHGQMRQHWVLDEGSVGRLDTSQSIRSFEDLTTNTSLSPGSMLVVGSLPNRQGSLGHQFLTENDGKLMQKVLIIRLSQTQHDDLFDPNSPLDLPEK